MDATWRTNLTLCQFFNLCICLIEKRNSFSFHNKSVSFQYGLIRVILHKHAEDHIDAMTITVTHCILDQCRCNIQSIRKSKQIDNVTDGIVLLVSIDPPTPTVTMATDPSTPTFQPFERRNWSSASGVMNMMITERACTPSWKPNEAPTVL